jgi:hypothetical protein
MAFFNKGPSVGRQTSVLHRSQLRLCKADVLTRASGSSNILRSGYIASAVSNRSSRRQHWYRASASGCCKPSSNAGIADAPRLIKMRIAVAAR